jgi:hypothetical protein
MRLPVTYQHGRYLIPAMPVFFIAGLDRDSAWLYRSITRRQGGCGLSLRARAVGGTIAAVRISFFVLGAQPVQHRMSRLLKQKWFDTATGLRRNRTGCLIAAHDIGALGYFGQRNLLDLAGLISPEVIPFIRDEDRLAYLDRKPG